MNEMGRAHNMHEYKGRCIRVGKLERKTPLWKPKHRGDLQEMGWCGGVWNGLIWLRIGTCDRVLWMR
jgi:hypothetical protein